MAHIEGRIVHDADAHTMETPNWLEPFAEPKMRDEVQAYFHRIFPDARKNAFQETITLHDTKPLCPQTVQSSFVEHWKQRVG